MLSYLNIRYSSPEWNLYSEVTLGNRRADAIAINVWPSRGLPVLGFEVKESRKDWLRELQDPSKAEVTFKECNQIFLVVSDKNIVRDDLPEGWGLLVLQGQRLKQIVKPKSKEVKQSKHFWARILQHERESVARKIANEAEERAKAIVESRDKSTALDYERMEKHWETQYRNQSAEVKRLTTLHRKQLAGVEWLAGMAEFERNQILESSNALHHVWQWMHRAAGTYHYSRSLPVIRHDISKLVTDLTKTSEAIEALNTILNWKDEEDT